MTLSIPAFHVSGTSLLEGAGRVLIASRATPPWSGRFDVRAFVHFLAADPYPVGTVWIKTSLNDGTNGTFEATSVDLINSHGEINPTVFVTGRCEVKLEGEGEPPVGLRFWLMVASNKEGRTTKGTPDVVGFAVHDKTGARIAYGTGPLRSGDFKVVAG